jgi:hypothetical protein
MRSLKNFLLLLCLELLPPLGESEAQLAAHLDDLVHNFDLNSLVEILKKTADA